MMRFTKGDMFETPADIRVNTVNCVGVMGAGVALAFRTRYPEMFAAYKRECDAGRIRPGQLHVWKPLYGESIVNFPTKRHWRDRSRYEDIESGLIALRDYLSHQGEVRVTLPALGCGHGGLDWNRVSEMIRRSLDGLAAEIVVFDPSDSRVLDRTDTVGTLGELRAELGNPDLAEALHTAGVSKIHYVGGQGRSWRADVSLVLPPNPRGRVETASASCVEELAGQGVSIGLYLGGHSAGLVSHALTKRARVIAWVPVGLLRYHLPETLQIPFSEGRLSVCSVADPDQRGSAGVETQTFSAQLLTSRTILVVDPDPKWLPRLRLSKTVPPRIFYVRYRTSNDEFWSRMSASPIGRTGPEGRPNIKPIVKVLEALRPELIEGTFPARRSTVECAKRELAKTDKPPRADDRQFRC